MKNLIVLMIVALEAASFAQCKSSQFEVFSASCKDSEAKVKVKGDREISVLPRIDPEDENKGFCLFGKRYGLMVTETEEGPKYELWGCNN